MKPSPFEQCRSYLLAQADVVAPREDRPPLRAVTISREAGAGAITIGRMASEYLEKKQADPRYPWAVFDHNLVKRVLDDHHLPKRIEQYMAEDAVHSVSDVVEDLLGVHPSSWTLVQHTTRTILRLAMAGNVIVVGRGSNIITARLKHVFHVRLVAPLEKRIRHVEAYYHLTHREAAEFVSRTDQARARYVRRNFQSRIQDPLEYHITINTGLVSFGEAARLIGDAVLNIHN
ncbi:MAG: cytidylate kinase-like family protein [Terrimicrobiaceae bacterium]|nr:cytidylate kinase-like family protein [Terrimicrobiaceae bacterium]